MGPEVVKLSAEFLERYVIVSELGRGGMGVVYLGEHLRLKRPVAIKFMLETVGGANTVALRRFEREAQILARIEHPSLVRVFDTGVEQSYPFIVFDYLAGRSLEEIVTNDGAIPVVRLQSIVLQVLAGLEALHAEGIVHRDLKPSNILITEDGARLIDLGIARLADSIEELTRTGRTVGTPSYMAPEQVVTPDVGPSADIYSLGIVMFFCLTRRLPFEGTPVQVIAKKTREDPPPVESIGQVPQAYAAVVNQCIRRNPEERPQTCADARALLTSASLRKSRRTTRKASSISVPPVEAAPGKRSTKLAVVAMVVAAVVAAGALLGRFRWGERGQLSQPTIERGLKGVTVRFSRTPPGPARLAVKTTDREYTVQPQSKDLTAFTAAIADLAPGELVTVNPMADGIVGLPTSFRFQPLAATDLAVHWTETVLEVTFQTSLPVKSRLRARNRSGYAWTPWDETPTQKHRFALDRQSMPLSARWELEHRLGDESVIERPMLPDAARLAFLDGVVEWIAARAKKILNDILVATSGANLRAKGDGLSTLKDVLKKKIKELPPLWFVEEVGGKDGILDHPGISPERKNLLYSSLAGLEEFDAALEQMRVADEYPYQKFYGEHFGSSAKPHYPGARSVPIRLENVDDKRPFDVLVTIRDLAVHQLYGPNQAWTYKAIGKVKLDRIAPGARVELHARARITVGRWIDARINGKYMVRLSRPNRSFPNRRSADVYTAFDPAYLREGVNEVDFSVPCAKPLMEGLQLYFLAVPVDPPGFDLRISD